MLLYDRILSQLKPDDLSLLKNENLCPLDLLEENNPTDSDTIGCLISKLSCVTIQMWNNQDILYRVRFMSAEEFDKIYCNNLAELHALIKRACDLNVQRAVLMDAIDKKALEMRP